MDMIDDYLDQLLNEKRNRIAKKTTYTKVTRQTKIDRALGALATKLAKEMNDPFYRRMVSFREKYFTMRKRIKQKYGPKVRARAVTGQGIGDIIEKMRKGKDDD